MRIIKRLNAFETNSSSTHSICICKDGVTVKKESLSALGFDEKNILVMPEYGFGWGYELIEDFSTKLSYVVKAVEEMNDCPSYAKPLPDAMNKPKKIIEIVEKFLEEQTGVRVTIDYSILYAEAGEVGHHNSNYYIDHQSLESFTLEEVFKSQKHLISFLFNEKSSLTLDNDNN